MPIKSLKIVKKCCREYKFLLKIPSICGLVYCFKSYKKKKKIKSTLLKIFFA